MMKSGAAAEIVSMVPRSAVQFLTFHFNIDSTGRFARPFIAHRLSETTPTEGLARYELRPGWNDEDPELPPPFKAERMDIEFEINKQRALEPFLDVWTPVPFLAKFPIRDSEARDQLGPTNWCRVRVTAADSGAAGGATHTIVFAFDTEVLETQPGRPYLAPSPKDAENEREFVLPRSFADIAWFLRDEKPLPGGGQINRQEWADRWIDDLFVNLKRAQRGGRAPRPEDSYPLEHAARFLTFIQFLGVAIPVPTIRLADTLSTDPSIKPVTVDLVLDVGNSRTCGMLIETFPNQQRIDLGNSYILQLRDLAEPHRSYSGPFESDVQLVQTHFGSELLSRGSLRPRAFMWPSPVRVGPEAARLRDRAEGTEGASGLSSPKRYLCDVEAVNQEWRFQPSDYGPNQEPPPIDLATRRQLNFRGDVLRQLSDVRERKFYARLATVPSGYDLDRRAERLTFSRSSFFTLLIAEIIVQTLALINNPQHRAGRAAKDAPRRLNRIILTMPTAMPVREQWLMRSRASGAVKLVWDLMGWSANAGPGLVMPEVHAQWDEASCAQLVYLYGEIAHKFAGYISDFMRLAGRDRPYVEPGRPEAARGVAEPSLRIASIDVGGGTSDLMITTYYVEQDRALVPCQNFREGFRIAGEDVVREVIERILLPAITRDLKARGLDAAREFLVDRFGSDRAGMTEPAKHLRRQCVLRVLKPAALALLGAYEEMQSGAASPPVPRKLGELVAAHSGVVDNRLAGRNIEYVDSEAVARGARDFKLAGVEIPFDVEALKLAVESTLGEVFENICDAVRHFDCDIVLLSGRPTRLPATIDLFVNKLAVAPDRVVALANYPPGDWYPFGGSSRFPIGDPKTATVVGCMLCALAEKQITNFTIHTNRLVMRSTANYIGALGRDGKLKRENVLFVADDAASPAAQSEATVAWYAPLPIGYRQVPIERWIATPIYRIKAIDAATAPAIRKPVQITLERELPEELQEYESRNFSAEEAKKEELRIVEAIASDGASVKRSFELVLDSIGGDLGYWLDNGVLSVA
jgi:hypothetical protein